MAQQKRRTASRSAGRAKRGETGGWYPIAYHPAAHAARVDLAPPQVFVLNCHWPVLTLDQWLPKESSLASEPSKARQNWRRGLRLYLREEERIRSEERRVGKECRS